MSVLHRSVLRRSVSPGVSAAVSLAALIAAGVPAPADSATCIWVGGAGTYATVASWSCGGVPGSADDVFIDGGNVLNSVVTLGGVREAGTLAISSGDELRLASGTMAIHNSAVTNNGLITIGTNSRFQALGGTTMTIGGTGTIVLDNSVGFSYLADTNATVILGAGQTVRGRGNIGLNFGIFVNNGLFSADVNAATIAVDARGGNGGILGGVGSGTAAFLNNGIMEATNGGRLLIDGGRYEQGAGGIIRALVGSTVTIDSDARIVGGTLTSVGSGEIFGTSGTRYFDDVTLSAGSNYRAASGDTQLSGTLANNGTITLGTNTRTFGAGAALTINGTGTIVLNDLVGFTQFLYTGTVTTLGSGQTVRGRGDIGGNGGIIINNGLFSADVSGQTLGLDPAGGNAGLAGAGVGTGGNAAFLNNGTLQASGGGILAIGGGRLENPGQIRALADSTISIDSDARIVGGTLQSVGTGAIAATNGTRFLDNVTLTNASQYNHSSAITVLGGTFTNNGTVTIGVNSRLRSDGNPLTINGTGTIVLNNDPGFSYLLDNAGTTTLGSGQTVRGRGDIGVNQAIIVNNGLISADMNGRSIDVDAQGGNGGIAAGVGSGTASMLNNATMQATNGGTLNIGGGRYEQGASGIIRALADSTVAINSDARIVGGTLQSVGTGVVAATTGSRYLDGVTLATGSQYGQASGITVLGGTFTNNGTVTIGVNSRLRSDGNPLTIGGTGMIVLNDSVGFAYLLDTAGTTTLGSGQTVRGRGDIGLNVAIIVNNGLISADVNGATIDLDVAGSSGGLAGAGVGTGGNAALLNNGTMEARGGGTLSVDAALYENSPSGTFAAVNGGTFNMIANASLFNLQAGGVLNGGNYRASDGTIILRATGIGSIVTIGTGAVGTDTIVTLDGPASVLNVQLVSAVTSIDASLTTVAQSGRLEVLGGRNLTIVGGGGSFTNAGVVQLGGGTFAATSFANSGEVFGFGTVGVNIANSGTVRAAGGTLSTQAILGTTGTVATDAGAVLAIGANSTAGFLSNGGQLALGTHNVTVTSDYTNASFGAGNGFNGRNSVSGTGLILATSATQDLSGPGLFAGNILDLGNIRVGDATSTNLTITNNGTQTTLRGAVQNSAAPGVTLGSPDFVIGPSGGSAVVSVSFAGATAGSLAGQTISVVNNFDNVANATLTLAGAAWNPAVGALSPNPVNLGNVRVGDTASGVVTIANVAPGGGFSEGLRITGTTPSANATISGVPAGIIAAGNSADATVGLSTATAGARTGTIGFDFVTDGTGTSGLAAAPITGGSVTLNANVFALANPIIADNLLFGNVLQGTVQVRSITIENRLLEGVLASFQEGLNAQFGAVSGDILSALGSITNLAAGGTDTTTLTVRLDTGTAGAKSGLVEILLQSNGDGTSGLGLFALPSKSVTVLGTVESEGNVYRLAEAGLAPTFVDLGNRRVGAAAPVQLLTISNLAAADGFSESLDASSGATTGRATASGGPISLLAAGESSQAISVSIDTSVAGANGSVTIDFASNGAGTSGLGVTPLPSQTVTLGGGVYQIAEAAAQPVMLNLAARRVGDAEATASLVIANNAAPTGGYTEALSAEVGASAGFSANGGAVATTANLAPGASQAVTIAHGTGTSGVFNGTVQISNTSVAVAGTGLGDLTLASQEVTVSAKVYQAAVAASSGNSIDFGVVRQGDAAPVAAITITNAAAGPLTDSLETSVGATPAGVSGSAPGPLGAGASGDAQFTLSTASAGQVAGNGTLNHSSTNPDMDALALAPTEIAFTGTVTDLAGVSLFKAGGAGSLSGGGDAYVLDLGSFEFGIGLVTTDIGVLNNVLFSAYSESLGGLFTGSDGDGFSFVSSPFADLAGGDSVAGNLLTFDYSTLGIGNYSRVFTFNGFSRYAGLDDLALGPVALTVVARISDEGGVIPEPAVWAQLIAGFGLVGGLVRRRRTLAGEAAGDRVAA